MTLVVTNDLPVNKKAALRLRRLSAGLCARCGTSPKLTNKTICRDCDEKQLAYRLLNRDRQNDRSRAHYLRNQSKVLENQRTYKAETRLNLKIEVITHYSDGSRCCALCGESSLPCLTIDHIYSGGTQHRALLFGDKNNQSSTKFYRWLRDNDYPTGYRVLCINCNVLEYLKSRITVPSKEAARRRARKLAVKTEFMVRLGGKCGVCGIDDINILTCHHLDGNGAEHRLSISAGEGGYSFYTKCLKIGNFDGLACRCFNHNCGEEWNG